MMPGYGEQMRVISLKYAPLLRALTSHYTALAEGHCTFDEQYPDTKFPSSCLTGLVMNLSHRLAD